MLSIKNEINHFKSYPHSMRYLLFANLLYAFVLPVIELFVGAYIVSPPDGAIELTFAEKQQNINFYLYYQFAVYLGIPIFFVVNGFLLRKIKVAKLYSFGVLLSGVSMALMMTFDSISNTGVIIAGLIMGASYGFYWANRDLMSLDVTNDSNRNYYFSIDTIFYTITWIFVPGVVGYIIAFGPDNQLYSGKSAYIGVTIIVFLLTIIATVIVNKGKFNNPKSEKFIFFKFDKLWNKMVLFSITKGILQGATMIFPILLILSIIGGVNVLGAIVSGGQIIAAIVLYIIGRYAKPKHRLLIYIISIALFSIAILIHGSMYSVLGVIIYNVLQFMAKPLHDVSYFPTEFKIIDIVSEKSKRSKYSYIVNHEFTLLFGRIGVILIFLFMAYRVSPEFALRYGLVVIAIIMILSILLAKSLMGNSKKE